MRFKDLEITTIEISKGLENSLDLFFHENEIQHIEDIFSNKDKFINTRNVGKIRIKEFYDFIQKLQDLIGNNIEEHSKSNIDLIKNFTIHETRVILNHIEKCHSTRLYNILNNLFKTQKINNITEFNKIKNNFHKIRNSGSKTAQEILNINIENVLSEHETAIITKDLTFISSIEEYKLILENYGSQRIQNRILDIYNTFTTSSESNYIENLRQIRGLGNGTITEIVNLITQDKNKIQLKYTEKENKTKFRTLLYFFPNIFNYSQDTLNDTELFKYILARIKNNKNKWNFNENKLVAKELLNHFKFNNHITHENLISYNFSIKVYCLFWAFPSQIYYIIYIILFNDPYQSITRERKRQILSKRIAERPYDIYKLSFNEIDRKPLISGNTIPNNNSFLIFTFQEKVFIINKKLQNGITLLLKRHNIDKIHIENYHTNEITLHNYLELFYNNQLKYEDNHITKIEINTKKNANQKLRKRIENFIEINQHLGVTSAMIAKEMALYGRSISKLEIPNWIRKEKLNLAQKRDWTWVIFNGKFHRDIPYKTFTEYFRTAIYELKNLFEIINYLRKYYSNYRIHNFYSLMRNDKVTFNYFKKNYILGLSSSNPIIYNRALALDEALRNPSQENLETIQNTSSHTILEQWFSQFTVFELNSEIYYLSHIQNELDYIDQTDFFKNNYRQEKIIFFFNDSYLNFHGKNLFCES